MKQYAAFIITAVILLASVILSSNFEMRIDNLAAVQGVKAADEEVYVLKDSEGHIAVYRPGDREAIITTDTLVNTLPYEDQAMLKEGIRIVGDKSLRVALEDYCS